MTRDYLGFLVAVHTSMMTLGVTEGALTLSRHEIGEVLDAGERGDKASDVAAWVLRDRARGRLPLHDDHDVFGSETISPKDLAA